MFRARFLSVIPSIAVRQAEVLRDGAAAQYGSDAIAGIMNFQLKDAPSGGSLEFRTGAFRDANPGDTSTCGTGILGDIQHSCNGIGGRGQAFTVAPRGRPWEISATPTSRTIRSGSSGPRAPPAAAPPISPRSSAAPRGPPRSPRTGSASIN